MSKDLGLSADRVRLRRRHLLHRVFHLRGAVQPVPGAVRRAQVDRPDHVQLGHPVRRDGLHRRRIQLLPVRVLLGFAEAGFFPGIIFFLTLWFPAAERARIIGLFMAAIPLSSVIGAPVSGALLGLDGWMGLHGWQWMYILEAIPAILLSVVVYLYLTDKPADAHVAGGGRARLADDAAGGGAPAAGGGPALQRGAGDARSARAGRGAGVFRRRRLQLRLQLLPAQHRQGLRR